MLGIFTTIGYHFGYKKCEEDENSYHPEYFNEKIMNLVKELATCTVEKENLENLSRECKAELATCKSDLDTSKDRETKARFDIMSCQASRDACKSDESYSKENYCNEMLLNLEKDNVACHTDLKHVEEKSDKCEAKYIQSEEDRESFKDKTVELNNDLTECRLTCKEQIENESDKRGKEWEGKSQRWKEKYEKWKGKYEECVRTQVLHDKCQKDLNVCEKKVKGYQEKSWF